ncbi:MAG: hypothetical protein U5K84_12910 [Alkalibacterium sp.]|nr:hypothetical protein [Alkalibacterium sp.]
MQLSDLLQAVKVLDSSKAIDTQISTIAYHSKDVKKGFAVRLYQRLSDGRASGTHRKLRIMALPH